MKNLDLEICPTILSIISLREMLLIEVDEIAPMTLILFPFYLLSCGTDACQPNAHRAMLRLIKLRLLWEVKVFKLIKDLPREESATIQITRLVLVSLSLGGQVRLGWSTLSKSRPKHCWRLYDEKPLLGAHHEPTLPFPKNDIASIKLSCKI